MGIKARKVARMKPKKKCCRSNKRCTRCPVVIMRMKRCVHAGMSDKKLQKALKKARSS